MDQPVNDNSFPWAWPVIAPGPSWSVPRISLPSCLGPLLQYQQEWWYYAGYAKDSGGNSYSLQFSINRFPIVDADPLLQIIACITGIGDAATNTYHLSTAYGLGVSTDPELIMGLTIPTVSDELYDISTSPGLGTAKTHVQLTGGHAGVAGSTYQLDSSATGEDAYAVSLQLSDERGMVLEWQSGYIGPIPSDQFSASSFEFAQPRLNITGGSLTLRGVSHMITSGMLWLDRQVLTFPEKAAVPEAVGLLPLSGMLSPEHLGKIGSVLQQMKPLYTGSWMGINLNNGLSVVLACFWQTPPEGILQWQTGTLLGLPPNATYGNVYFPLESDPRRMPNGGSYLKGIEKGDPEPYIFDFDVNILDPDHPDISPHWQSSVLGKATYATAWQIRTGSQWQAHGLPATLYLKALVSGCENVLPSVELPFSGYWEGAAAIFSDKALTQEIGHAFVEQMGFN